MEILGKIGWRLFGWFALFVIVLVSLASSEKIIRYIDVVGLILILSFFNLMNELRLKYYILFRKSNKNFRSSKEAFIADYFDKKKIKYIYEPKLRVGSNDIKPDFFLPEFDVYVEYWGMWNHDFEYKKQCNHKRNLYKKEGINLIELYPDNLISINKLDQKFNERLLKILKR